MRVARKQFEKPGARSRKPEADTLNGKQGKKSFAVIGPGKVGTAMAKVLVHAGYDCLGLFGRDPDKVKADLGIDPKLPVIGRLGRLGKDKGLEDWLLSCYYLQQQGLAFTPLIVGPEARDAVGYRGNLKLIAESLPVKGIIWVDGVDNVSDYLEIMDVFLYPSPTEGFGLVFIEAMFCGAVVVSYKNDVTFETIGGYSILTDNSIPALVEGVKQALDPNVRGSIQGMAHDFVRSEYDAERMAKEYSDLYKTVKQN